MKLLILTLSVHTFLQADYKSRLKSRDQGIPTTKGGKAHTIMTTMPTKTVLPWKYGVFLLSLHFRFKVREQD